MTTLPATCPIVVQDDGDRWQLAITCSNCGERILDMDQAIALWFDESPEKWTVVHKGDCDRLRAYPEDVMPPYTWMELRVFLTLLMASVTDDEEVRP